MHQTAAVAGWRPLVKIALGPAIGVADIADGITGNDNQLLSVGLDCFDYGFTDEFRLHNAVPF